MSVSDFLRAEPAEVVEKPEDERRHSLRRAYSLARGVVGALGIALPVGLIFGEPWLDGSVDGRGSLSAYYHSGLRDYFVGTLVVVSVLLFLYKFFEHSLDNLLSWIAGAGALGVAFFPTHVPEGLGVLTPLQDRFGEGTVAGIHYACATIFFACMAWMSWLFGRRELQRDNRPKLPGPLPPSKKRNVWVHWVCASLVSLAVLLIVGTRWVDVFGSQDIIVGESVALIAFGISWTYKGFELDLMVPSVVRDTH